MQFYTIDQVADILALSPQGVRAEITAGNLRAIQVGGRREWRVEEEWLREYVAAAEAAAARKLNRQPRQVG